MLLHAHQAKVHLCHSIGAVDGLTLGAQASRLPQRVLITSVNDWDGRSTVSVERADVARPALAGRSGGRDARAPGAYAARRSLSLMPMRAAPDSALSTQYSSLA